MTKKSFSRWSQSAVTERIVDSGQAETAFFICQRFCTYQLEDMLLAFCICVFLLQQSHTHTHTHTHTQTLTYLLTYLHVKTAHVQISAGTDKDTNTHTHPHLKHFPSQTIVDYIRRAFFTALHKGV